MILGVDCQLMSPSLTSSFDTLLSNHLYVWNVWRFHPFTPLTWTKIFPKLSSQEARVTVEGQVLPINLQRTGTYPVEAKGRHQGWLGSLAELMEPAWTKRNRKKYKEIMLCKHCCQSPFPPPGLKCPLVPENLEHSKIPNSIPRRWNGSKIPPTRWIEP